MLKKIIEKYRKNESGNGPIGGGGVWGKKKYFSPTTENKKEKKKILEN